MTHCSTADTPAGPALHPGSAWILQQTVGQGSGNGQFNTPSQVAVDASGNVYVADSANNRMQRFTAAGVYAASIGGLTGIRGVAVDSGGNVYVTSGGGVLKKYNAGLVLQWTATAFGAELVHLATDGSFVWATTASHTIAKYSTSDGSLIATLAGAGTGNGQFATPFGIARDGSHLYVVDQGNSRVQKLQPNQSYAAQVGAAGSGNGQFASLRGIAVDASGNVWACDEDNERVQKFSAALAYSAQFGASGSGNGQFASNNGPYDLAVAPDGTLWVVDRGNNRVQQFDASGTYLAKIDSIGSSTAYAFAAKFGADGAGNGQFNAPWQCALDTLGNLYVADANNNRVQKFDASGAFVCARRLRR
jgi:tripartite motif-containing protein 71